MHLSDYQLAHSNRIDRVSIKIYWVSEKFPDMSIHINWVGFVYALLGKMIPWLHPKGPIWHLFTSRIGFISKQRKSLIWKVRQDVNHFSELSIDGVFWKISQMDQINQSGDFNEKDFLIRTCCHVINFLCTFFESHRLRQKRDEIRYFCENRSRYTHFITFSTYSLLSIPPITGSDWSVLFYL